MTMNVPPLSGEQAADKVKNLIDQFEQYRLDDALSLTMVVLTDLVRRLPPESRQTLITTLTTALLERAMLP